MLRLTSSKVISSSLITFYSLLLMMLLVACGAGAGAANVPSPESVGDPAVGQEIFNTSQGDALPCTFCHVVDASPRGTGPSLQGVASRAGSQVDDVDAVAYLRQSIIEPNAFVADGSPRSRMFAHYGEVLSEAQINDLIAYLLTLE